jgi:hypothetical protein
MNDMDFEVYVRSIATRMEYPRTPDIAGTVTARLRSSTRPRLFSKAAAWSLTLMVILISSLMLIPPARAAILEFIQVGVVRIFRVEPTLVAPTEPVPSTMMPVTATPESTSQTLFPILEGMAGEMILEAAQEKVSYPILLPAYPLDLGLPDRVFVQEADGAMTILVWLAPQQPDQVQLSLHLLPPNSWAIKKIDPTVITETNVNGQYAIWATGPYAMRLENGDIQFIRMINGNVLIWDDGNVTYRLETDLPLEEAIRIAESLAPIP